MLITPIGVRLPHPLRFQVTVSLLALYLVMAGKCLGQEQPPQTEEQRQAREALNKGVQDFKNGQSDEAIADFTRAKQLDPQLLNARLYLATAYASQYIPGAPREENARHGREAAEEYKGALTLDPQNLSAIDGMGSILFQMAGQPYKPAMFQESKSYHLKHVQLRPDDPEPYYWVGVIDWTMTFRASSDLRARYNKTNTARQIKDIDPLPALQREEYRNNFGPMIEEGIDALKHAIQLRPDYDDAMAYLNLLYRRKADTVATRNEREQLLRQADELVDKIMQIKTHRDSSPN
jgi:tetratricopeptide (TPR) repeat protein